MALNRCIFNGRIVRDPELKHTNSGIAVVSFTVAVSRNFKNQATGEYDTDFIDCVAWKQTAEYIGRNVSKGQLVDVDGRLQIRQWVDKTGNNKKIYEIVADNVYLCGPKPKKDENNDFEELYDTEGSEILPF